MSENKEKKGVRNFGLTTMALKNKNTVFLLAAIIMIFGSISYKSLPKELFPEVVFPTLMVNTIYFGNSAVDIENLVTRPLEKELESVEGLKKLTSTSAQDASMIFVEFNADVEMRDAKQEVRDALDRAATELPQNDNSFIDPMMIEFDMSEVPIITLNLYGSSLSDNELRSYAELLEDRIETISEIRRVDIAGINEEEIQVEIDPFKMEQYEVSFYGIKNAISGENMSISGGEIKLGDYKRSLRIDGEFKTVEEIGNVVIKREHAQNVYLKDVATISKAYKDNSTYARLNGDKVVALRVVKKGGENLLSSIDQIKEILEEAKNGDVSTSLSITLTEDQSDMVRKQLANLENSMIMGVIFVVMVLFFFLGVRNAIFVGIAIPLSMFLSFAVIGLIGYKINMIVLFSLILALGMLVDNAIVVVENIYRFVDKGYKPFEAARIAVGEIAWPIISSTATTLAAFLPLAFWEGIVGEFMFSLPITLIIVLTSSLLVALVIIPVFSATFISVGRPKGKKINKKRQLIIAFGLIGFGLLFDFGGKMVFGNLLIIFGVLGIIYVLWLHKTEAWFQDIFLSKLENLYHKILQHALQKYNPLIYMGATILLLIFTIGFFFGSNPKVEFFPAGEPNNIYVQAVFPIGIDIDANNEYMKANIEPDVQSIIYDSKYEKIVESAVTTVGAGYSNDFSTSETPYKSVIAISFIEYKYRDGVKTTDVLKELSTQLVGKYPGVELSVFKEEMGPPAGDPISLEISGPDYATLINLTDSIQQYLDLQAIEGIEGLKKDLFLGKPETIIKINRQKAQQFGLSTSMIAMTIRNALYGDEAGDFKEGEDEFPIMLRYSENYRNKLETLLETKMIFHENGSNNLIPISAVVDIENKSTYNVIRRSEGNRVITLYSNIIEGYNGTSINNQLAKAMEDFTMPEKYKFEFTGEQKEQEESMAFLGRAMAIALAIIMLILVSQFNSFVKPIIIGFSILFSTIGVFGGLATFNMSFIVVMTGIGIVSLAGIVVNNAIVLIDYIDLLKERARRELGLEEGAYLPVSVATQCIVEAGQTRLRPVLLTAITTILGLISMATGFNIDFNGMLAEFKPDIFFGGDMVLFWGPISWTVIFGLSFSTFLTLIIVPVMYRLVVLGQKKVLNVYSKISGKNEMVK